MKPAFPAAETIYRQLYRLRRFDEMVLENFPRGIFFGTTHTYLGQEANAVGVLSCLGPEDIVFSNHRCHGHFLASGGDPRALFAELMGKATGVCGGRGGSQHLHWRNFYSNGVQGGIVPVATGMALAEKRKTSGAIAVCFLGDGTLGEGVVYEALNLAALWQVPILYVVENNHIAQTTPFERAAAGSVVGRFEAFGIAAVEVDSSDVLEIMRIANNLVAEARTQKKPQALVIHTARFGPHSKGDDTRPPEAIATLRQQRDPLKIHAPRLSPEKRAAIETEVDAHLEAAFQQALADPFPTPSLDPRGLNGARSFPHEPAPIAPLADVPPAAPPQRRTVLDCLNAALHRAFAGDERVLLLGEDVLDPYGGAFKVTRGLSTAFPGRVLATPISEAGIVGTATGMALRGLRPVVEIMFGDFVTLIADQLINHAAKFPWMYGDGLPSHDPVTLPLVIRTPMGGRRGYGPTHSQSLEKLFLGVPGLQVVAPLNLGDPGDLLEQAILQTEGPLLFVENKLQYLLPVLGEADLTEFDVRLGEASGYVLTLRGAPPPCITLAAYGYMAELARQALLRLAYEYEIFAELLAPVWLSPFRLPAALSTDRLLTVEEGTLPLGWGAEVVARTLESGARPLKAARRLGARPIPIPASGPLEAAALPGVDEIVQAARMMV